MEASEEAPSSPVFSESTKAVTDENGGLVRPGDRLAYTIVVKNTGKAVAHEVVVRDAVPASLGTIEAGQGGRLTGQASSLPAIINKGAVYLRGIETTGFAKAIGEAATHIPEHVRLSSRTIHWGMVVATRDQLAHDHAHLDHDMLWSVVETDIPALHISLQALRATLPHDRS